MMFFYPMEIQVPVSYKKIGGKYRITEPGGGISKTTTGRARDGGGHLSKEKALAQVRAINASLKRRGKI